LSANPGRTIALRGTIALRCPIAPGSCRRQATVHTNGRLRTQNGPLGRSRTQAFSVLRPNPKRLYRATLGVVFSDLGRLGRKIPEHLIVASGQWLVAKFEASRVLTSDL
jgi:hypothetical protein